MHPLFSCLDLFGKRAVTAEVRQCMQQCSSCNALLITNQRQMVKSGINYMFPFPLHWLCFATEMKWKSRECHNKKMKPIQGLNKDWSPCRATAAKMLFYIHKLWHAKCLLLILAQSRGNIHSRLKSACLTA